MNIHRMKSFSASAEVLGQMVDIAWDGSQLTIHEVDLAMANQIMEVLSRGSVMLADVGSLPVEASGEAPKPAPKPPAAPKAPEPPEPVETATAADSGPVAASLPRGERGPADDPVLFDNPEDLAASHAEDSEPEEDIDLSADPVAMAEHDDSEMEEAKEPPKEEIKVSKPKRTGPKKRKASSGGDGDAGVVEPAFPLVGSDGEIPEDLYSARRLRDVLEWMKEREGITDRDAIVARCLELKPRIPVLSRINDMPGRVDRNLKVIQKGI